MLRRSFALLPGMLNTYGIGLFAYFGVAIVSALMEWASFIAALEFFSPVPAAIAGFLLATIVNFVLSRRYVFRSKRSLSAEFILVIGMSTVAFTANIFLFYVLYAFFSINLIVAKIMGTCFGFAFNYAFRQFFIFSRLSRFTSVSEILRGKNTTS